MTYIVSGGALNSTHSLTVVQSKRHISLLTSVRRRRLEQFCRAGTSRTTQVQRHTIQTVALSGELAVHHLQCQRQQLHCRSKTQRAEIWKILIMSCNNLVLRRRKMVNNGTAAGSFLLSISSFATQQKLCVQIDSLGTECYLCHASSCC